MAVFENCGNEFGCTDDGVYPVHSAAPMRLFSIRDKKKIKVFIFYNV